MTGFRSMWNAQGRVPSLQLWLLRLSIVFAALGGVAIFAASLTVSLSVALRSFGFGGIRGDFELVEVVAATCASLFLPLCQLRRGHVLVDLFTDWMPTPSKHRLDGAWTLVFALALGILSWRLGHGLVDVYGYGDRTMLLKLPLWWVYVPAVLSTGLACFIALVSANSLLRGTTPEMEHI